MVGFSSVLIGGIIPSFHLPKWLTNPWGWLKDKFVDLYHSLGDLVQNLIIHPIKPIPGDWLGYLYGNAVGLSALLVGAVAIWTVILIGLRPMGGSRLARAFVAAAIIGAYPVWFAIGNWLTDAGSQINQSFAVDPNNGQKVLLLPDIHNVLGAIIGIVALLAVGGILLLIFVGYEILFILANVAGLPLLALSPLGEGFKRRFEQVVVLAVITSFLGRLIAVIVLSIGTLTILHMPVIGNNAAVQVIALVVTLGMAIYSQFWLLKQAERVYGNMTGRTLGTSKVTGVVQTIKRPQRGDGGPAAAQAAHTRALAPALVATPTFDHSRYAMSSSRMSSTHTLAPTPRPRRDSQSAWKGFRNRN